MKTRGWVTIRRGDAVYREAGDLRERLGITINLLSRWARAGAVERVRRGGRYWYREDDVFLLVACDARTTNDLGLYRTPEREREYTRRWMLREHDRTAPYADHAATTWDLVEDVLVLGWEGPIEELALRLGRTYDAIIARRGKLRKYERLVDA